MNEVTRIHPDLVSLTAHNLYVQLTDTLNDFVTEHEVSNFEVLGVFSIMAMDIHRSMEE